MQRSAAVVVGAVWFALVGLLGMHAVATASPAPAPVAVHGAGTHAPEVLSATPADAAVDLDLTGTSPDSAMVHMALACLVLLVVAVVALRRHRPAAPGAVRPPARAPALDLPLDLSRLSAALRWRTDPVRQAVLLT